MLLCIDMGNTNIACGIYKDNTLLHSFRFHTETSLTVDEYGMRFLEIINYFGCSKDAIKAIIISSVVPSLDKTFEEIGKKYFNINPLFVGPGIKTGVKIKITNPKQLGADLLTGAVGACEKYGYPIIVIDMGTATTLSVINKAKEFLGVIIIPGVKTAFANLQERTSKLETAKLEQPKSIIGTDTVSSIQSGMIYGTACSLDGLVKKIKTEIGPAKVVITGGISSFIYTNMEEEVIYDEDLILESLKIIYQKNIILL